MLKFFIYMSILFVNLVFIGCATANDKRDKALSSSPIFHIEHSYNKRNINIVKQD